MLFQWEDYVDPPFLAGYRQQFGETPRTSIFADEDEAFAKLRAGFKPDVMGPCYYELPRWREAGLLRPIDISRLKNWNKISPRLRNLPGISAGPGKVWFVPHYWGQTSVTYRTDLAPEYAQNESWKILFDPKYKGRIAALEGVDDTVPLVARTIGVNAYTMNDADWRRVQSRLRELERAAALCRQRRHFAGAGSRLGRTGGGDQLARDLQSPESRRKAGGLHEPAGRAFHLCLRPGDRTRYAKLWQGARPD